MPKSSSALSIPLPVLVCSLVSMVLMYKLLHLQGEFNHLKAIPVPKDIIIQKNCQTSKVNADEVHSLDKQSIGESTIKTEKLEDMMYTHPKLGLMRGRPFSGLVKHGHILQEYLDHPTVTIDPEKKNIVPQLVTALSANHFEEHKMTIGSVFENFPGRKVLVYDLGIAATQHKQFMQDDRYDYRKFNFTKYNEEVWWLTNMSFKVLILRDCLMEFGSCLWFDTSLEFFKNDTEILDKYVYERNSSFIYYIRPAIHNPAWATHPLMYSYFPSNVTSMLKKTFSSGQGGATITVNTDELKHGVMKWAIACALTPECIAPNYPINHERTDEFGVIKYGTRYNPWGSFEIRHCDKKNSVYRPFTCHRFDQSMWMILVANLYDLNPIKFRAAMNDIIAMPDRTMAGDKLQKASWKLGYDKGIRNGS